MSLEKVQQALIQKFMTDFGEVWNGRIAWENVAFTAQPGEDWLAVHFMPADERLATLGPYGVDQSDGILQVTISTPIGKGEGTIRSTVNSLRATFKPQSLLYDGQAVTILTRSRAKGGPVDGFFAVPFTIRWRARLTRTS